MRQQVGWVVLYARRARDSEATLRLDRAAMYAATLGAWAAVHLWKAWHERPMLFGQWTVDLPAELLSLVVPLLPLPQNGTRAAMDHREGDWLLPAWRSEPRRFVGPCEVKTGRRHPRRK